MSVAHVLIVGVQQETATGNPVPTRLDDFDIVSGAQAVDKYSGSDTEVGGALAALLDGGAVPVVGTVAFACSGGVVERAACDELHGAILAEVARHSDGIDGVLVVLHGAMVAEGEADPDGRLLAAIRAIVAGRPVIATLDLHAVLTDRMIRAADVLVPFHTYPHTDHAQTGQRGARLLLRMLSGQVRPTVAVARLPLLARGDELLTATGLLGRAVRVCQDVERRPTGLAAAVLIGNPYTDVVELASNVLVATDNDEELARATAESLAALLWDRRHDMTATTTPLADAVSAAHHRLGLTVFSDAADATSSGAPGDSNAVLRALLETGWTKRAVLSIVDPRAAAAAAAAGVGARLDVELGGQLDPARHRPLQVSAVVLSVGHESFRYENGTLGQVGTAAVLRIGSIDVLVTARRVWVVGRAVFTSHGLDPLSYDLVVVKSPGGFRPHYEAAATAIVVVDTPGCTSLSLTHLEYKRRRRPMFPWDDDFAPDLKAAVHRSERHSREPG